MKDNDVLRQVGLNRSMTWLSAPVIALIGVRGALRFRFALPLSGILGCQHIGRGFYLSISRQSNSNYSRVKVTWRLSGPRE